MFKTGHFAFGLKMSNNKSRVPDQSAVSQAWYIVEIHHSGRAPSKFNLFCFVLELACSNEWKLGKSVDR